MRPAVRRLPDLELMRKHSPARVQVKAAGGIRDLDALLAVRAIGVSRVGATRTEAMLEECRKRLGLETDLPMRRLKYEEKPGRFAGPFLEFPSRMSRI